MSMRLILIGLAILALAYGQPVPEVPEVVENAKPVQEINSEKPVLNAYQRTLFLLLPLLFPNEFYIPTTSG
ncbi:uncharacterized protein LOC26535462 [Drosophila yakuba]|uniref:Uncharacterized protein n=1 Tax=Drosophila yakuba TaxID=7245 RepID=A0A0R1E560_DROYA|nr:uncharacterized protein LOC26535462 [Drosophila yakuba]XP_039489959.1 uncharacterized protein LOC120450839 [Drosophila santomea]XP_039489960.1 uncharacterized protein LOC120450839 [Drosophila santomea]KRK03331.1 uncharacterized protein Dyak_GE28281 [Drosophila yakuba]